MDGRADEDEGAGRPHRRANPFEALRAKLGNTLPPGTAPPPAPAPAVRERVTVRRERAGRGGKTVTVVEGPGLEDVDLAALARDAARAHGVGARVEGGALVLQGDQSERLAGWLVARGFGRVERGN